MAMSRITGFLNGVSPVCFLMICCGAMTAVLAQNCQNSACYPRFLDLIQDLPNRTVTVTSTCGTPASDYELRFRSPTSDAYQQQTCDAADAQNAHPSTALYDSIQSFFFSRPNLDSWWQSENGATDVQMTLMLGNSFLFQGTRLAFRGLRPRSLFFEKSSNFGQTWLPLKYYAVSCSQTFPGIATTEVATSYFPICEERYVVGDVSTENPFNIQEVRYNPAQELGPAFSQEPVMRYFTITNVRVTLGRPGSDADLRNFFAVADWEVTGQCLCFGHAEACQGEDASDCVCQHNTAGRHCDRCLPLFNNKPWQAATAGQGSSANECEDCGCNSYADSCVYDAFKGYGICQGCRENTGGDKCERCNENFFRNPFVDPSNNDTCVACMCNANGTQLNSVCNETDGNCICKLNVQNVLCDECKDTFFNLNALNPVGCQPCDCDPIGSLGSTNFCDKLTGQCICKTNVEGSRCDTCKTGSYNLDETDPDGCSLCSCGLGASLSGQCDVVTGACACRSNITGRACNETLAGFYVPRLDGMAFEAELASADNGVTIVERPTDTATARHTGRGFLTVPVSTTVTFADITVPRKQAYEVVLRYESAANWAGVRIQLTQHVTVPYECPGMGSVDSPILLTSNVPEAGVGGAQRFGLVCLDSDSVYNISVVVGLADSGASATILLDSLVLLPALSDLNVFTSDMTSNLTREAMTSCWYSAVVARPSLEGSMEDPECSSYEFSIMAEVYNGAIACSCNDAGTVPGTACDPYSGQCQCVGGVTSQSCDYCAAYHFGYNTAMGCTPCGCDVNGAVTQSCNRDTGGCDCHANVVGEQCDACLPEHYGLYTGTGCVPCTCHANYSLDNMCADSGQCSCKPGVGGQDCTECAPGFFQLTTDGCTFCECDQVGSAQSGCDLQGDCLCQEGTIGLKCEMCAAGFYGFGPWSERGCSRCYCSAHSAQCTTAAGWFRSQVVSSWSLLNSGAVSPRWTGVNASGADVPLNEVPILDVSNPRLILELTQPTNSTEFFFASPDIYKGDFRTAYGQTLAFTLSQSTDQEPFINPDGDVFIDGLYVNEALVAALPHAPNSSMVETEYQLKLHENYWRKGSLQGDQPTAEYVIQALAGIQSIRIRGKYSTLPGVSVFLHSTMLNYATQGDGGITSDTADFVENCTCPTEYMGSFCESCSPGYKRAIAGLGPFADCVPCDCNGHSTFPCDPDTGVCQGCGDNTGGDFCDLCLGGYFGDATGGTPGDCQPCLCPGPPGSVNSFAAACDGNGVCLDCTAGHSGDNCQTCVSGYYGVPTDTMTNDGQCLPCSCSLSPADCNTVTGECLNCTGNTGGHNCDVCDFGFWGRIENCQECVCDPMGGPGNCSLDLGVCSCYPNVVGDRCAQCAPDTWGFASGAGCTPCDCHTVGTMNQQTQCDLITGQCECKPRVMGLRCDQCQQGYWNIDQECILCECSPEGTDLSTCDPNGNCTCDLLTGQCGCKSVTIAGRTCNRCGRVDEDGSQIVSEVFDGTFPNCEPCPECFQNWRKAFQDIADLFYGQQATLMELLANYGSLTTAEVDGLLASIRGNLSNAAQAILVGTREVVDLEDIEAGFRQISSEVANFMGVVDAVESRQLALAAQMADAGDFTGDVVVGDGSVKNADQLQAELAALTDGQTVLFQLGNGSWVDIQGMYNAIEAAEQRVQQLTRDVDVLLQDIERAALDRRGATDIIDDNFRTAEYADNDARLTEIDGVLASYPLASTSQNATAARQMAEEVNRTSQGSLAGLEAVRAQAEALAYQTEVGRFNTTNAEQAGQVAQSAAVSYKDIALSTKANMTGLYVQAIDTFAALQEAQVSSSEALAVALAVQQMTNWPAAAIELLVGEINAAMLTDADVQTLLQDATSKFGRAEQARTSAGEAQQEAESVSAQLQSIEDDLTEAERVRTDTAQRVTEIDANITVISATANQVQQQADQALVSGQESSAAMTSILRGVRSADQCFSARRNQAQDAADRAGMAQAQAVSAQQTYTSSAQDALALDTTIATAKERSSEDLTAIQTVVKDAQALQQDLISAQQLADLDALMTQYMTQRNQMQELATTLEGLETSLDAVLTNLDSAEGGSIQCN